MHFGRLSGPAGFSRTVAIKRLHAQFAKDPEFVAMFLDEARVAARIRHPNVVPTLDVVATEGEVFLVMEYVQGESLSKLLRALRAMMTQTDARITASIMAGVLHGLHAAHEAVSEQPRLDGKPVLVDPGDHVVRYQTAGQPAVEEHVLVHAGEKSRVLSVQFGSPSAPASAPPAAPASAASASGTTPAEAAPASTHGSLVPAAILGGVAVVAFASEAYFGLTGLSQRSNDLAVGGCAPNCSDSEKSSIQTKFLIADISLGVGVVSAVTAAYLFFTSRSSSEPAAQGAHLDLTPTPRGAAAGLRGSF